MHAERQAERLRAERPVEPFRQQTAVFDPAVSRPSDGRRPTPARFDESEILDDVDHLDELDGQEYPAGFDGLERGDYIDLDDPARTYHADPTVTVPR
jgi:hypothetical protein